MKSEKEKMLSGKPYKSNDKELFEDRQRAKELIFELNTLRPGEVTKRNDVVRQLFGNTGNVFFIEQPFRCDYGFNIDIGENLYINYNCVILDCAKVTIGNNVLFAPNVSLFTAGHPIHPEKREQEFEYAFPITIGNNVWIGGNVIINPGVTIGDNTVIGSGSVVTKNIPASVVAAGNPCRVLRKITDEDKQYYFKKLRFE
jgi:maltose O-acetyltransferase